MYSSFIFHCTTFVCSLALLTSSFVSADTLLYRDKIDDSPGSLNLPIDGIQWSHSFFPALNRATLVSREKSKITILSDFGDLGYLPDSPQSSLNYEPFLASNNFLFIPAEDGKEIGFTWEVKVQTIVTQNPFAPQVADDDYRLGGLNLLQVDFNLGFNMNFYVTSNEIYAVHESLGQVVGFPNPYPLFFAFKKIADKNP